MTFSTLIKSACLYAVMTLAACGEPAPQDLPLSAVSTAVESGQEEAPAPPAPDKMQNKMTSSVRNDVQPALLDVSDGLPEQWFQSLPAEARSPGGGATTTNACAPYMYLCCWFACGASGHTGPYCEGVCHEWLRQQCPGTACR